MANIARSIAVGIVVVVASNIILKQMNKRGWV